VNSETYSKQSEGRVSSTWAWFGLLGVVLGYVATWAVQFSVSLDALDVGGTTLLAELTTDGNEVLWRVTSGLGYLSVAMLIVFAIGLRGMLERRSGGDMFLPNVITASFLVTCGAMIIAWSFRAQVFDGITAYAADPSAHVAINRLSQDTGLSTWAGLIAATAAATVGAFRGGLFPKWFGWFSGLITTLMVLLVLVGGAFPANIPAGLWLLVLCGCVLKQTVSSKQSVAVNLATSGSHA
jgi:hypothetical protein